MNILVIGNNSMIGKRLINQLRNQGINNVFTAGRNGNDLDIYIDFEKMDTKILNKDIKVDVIVHCAASFYGDDTEGCTKNVIINSLGAIQIANLSTKLNCKKIIYLSSIFTYKHIENEYYGSYGISKKHGSDYLELICKNEGIDFVELICAQIYDEFGEAKKHQPLFYYIIDKASRGEDIIIYGDLDVTRNFLHVRDLVDIIIRLIDSEIVGSFPCCDLQNYSLSQIASIAYEVFEKKGEICFDSMKENIKKVYIPTDRIKIFNLVNYIPQIDLYHGIRLIKKNLYNK